MYKFEIKNVILNSTQCYYILYLEYLHPMKILNHNLYNIKNNIS